MLYRFPLSLVRQGLFPVVAWLALLLCPSVALAEGFVTFGLGRTNFGEEEVKPEVPEVSELSSSYSTLSYEVGIRTFVVVDSQLVLGLDALYYDFGKVPFSKVGSGKKKPFGRGDSTITKKVSNYSIALTLGRRMSYGGKALTPYVKAGNARYYSAGGHRRVIFQGKTTTIIAGDNFSYTFFGLGVRLEITDRHFIGLERITSRVHFTDRKMIPYRRLSFYYAYKTW